MVTQPSLQDLKEALERSDSDVSKDGHLTRLLMGAIEYCERKTRRQFSTGVETRYFDGNDKGYLVVDEFQAGSITRIAFLNPDRAAWKILATGQVNAVGFTAREPIRYRIEIINAITENPYRVLGPSPYIFPRGSANIEITANWGTWAVLPQGLQNAILDVAVAKYNRNKARGIRSVSVGGESISYSDTDLSDKEAEDLMEYSRPLVEIFPD